MRDDSPARRRRLRIASDAGKQSAWRVQEWKLSGETASVLVHDDSVHFTRDNKDFWVKNDENKFGKEKRISIVLTFYEPAAVDMKGIIHRNGPI